MTRHSFEFGDVRSIAAVDSEWAVLLAGDGEMFRFGLESGERELLPYRLPSDFWIKGVDLVR